MASCWFSPSHKGMAVAMRLGIARHSQLSLYGQACGVLGRIASLRPYRSEAVSKYPG